MKWSRFIILTLFILTVVEVCAQQAVKVEGEAVLVSSSASGESYEVIFNNRLAYESLFVRGHFNFNGESLNLLGLFEKSSDLDFKRLGELLFTANDNTNALSKLIGESKFLSTLSVSEIQNSVGAVFKVLAVSENGTIADVHAVISSFGKDANFESKLLFLQMLSSMTEEIYDSAKLNPNFSWDRVGRESTEEMLAALIDYLHGDKVNKGVCFDTEFMMNEFAALLGFHGAFVFGSNESGMLHPEGLYFDTSNPHKTRAILHDWTKMAIINFDTPTELADALEKINGSHLMARVLYDGDGRPLKIIHSSADKTILKAMGQEEITSLIASIVANPKANKNEIIQNSNVMAAIEYGGFRLEVREFKNIIADYNLMFVLALPLVKAEGELFDYSGKTTLGFVQEGSGELSTYSHQPTNNHMKFIFRHESALSTKKRELIIDMLSYSLYASFESIVGIYQHNDDVVFKQGLMIPIIESRVGGVLYFFDKRKDRFEIDVSSFTSFNLLYPKQLSKILSSLSNYLNAVLNESHLWTRLWADLDGRNFIIVDADYTYTNINHEMKFSIGLTDNRLYSVSCSYTRGLTNNLFPFFYRTGSSQFDVDMSFLLIDSRDLLLWLAINFEVTSGPTPGNRLFIGVRIQH